MELNNLNCKEDNFDLLIENATIITMDSDDHIISNGIIGISEGEIVLLEEKNHRSFYSAKEAIDASGKFIFPGLINTHVHVFQSLLKGLGTDLGLKDWIKAVTALYGQKITPDLNYLAAQASVLQSLECGCTTIVEFSYLNHIHELSDAVINAFNDIGIRSIFIRTFQDCGEEFGIPSSFLEPVSVALKEVVRLENHYVHKKDNKIKIWTGPCVTWSTSQKGFKELLEFCKDRNMPYSMHLLETQDDNHFMMKNTRQKVIPFLSNIGFLSPTFLAIHCVKIEPEEMYYLKEHNVKVSYNPVSNMYLGVGIAPVAELRNYGVTISIGTDGAASNNTLDMLETIKIGILLQKAKYRDSKCLLAKDVLKMATIDAAKALHLDTAIGSLENGKRADLFIFNPNKLRSAPIHDPIATIVYSGSTQNVETTVVDGKILYHNGVFRNGIALEEYIFNFQKIASQL